MVSRSMWVECSLISCSVNIVLDVCLPSYEIYMLRIIVLNFELYGSSLTDGIVMIILYM
ncbi:hypothetical protein Hanom_Chr08g00705701 [Helianthus anomalus]